MNFALPQNLNVASGERTTELRVAPAASVGEASTLSHLQHLEAESIHIIREATAESDNPVLLYSIGKDSSVLLHLALKAFFPVVVAVNKMDLVDWSQSRFVELQAELRAFLGRLDIDEVTFIPLSARKGENLVCHAQRTPWYEGPSLLEYLETVEIGTCSQRVGFRMPVQYVNRPDSAFRGYCGLITSGEIYSGMPVQTLPSGQRTHVARIVTADGDLAHARTGQAVTLVLADDIDVSRGDLISGRERPATVIDRFEAKLVWIGPDTLAAGRPYLMKLATVTATAIVELPLRVIDLETNRSSPAKYLAVNDIGMAFIRLDRFIAVDSYADSRDTGSFILIDSETGDTLALGTIETVKPPREIGGVRGTLPCFIRSTETHAGSIVKAISWRTAGSLDTFVIATLITGSSNIVGGVALAEVLTKGALYYAHERVWSLIPWGRR